MGIRVMCALMRRSKVCGGWGFVLGCRLSGCMICSTALAVGGREGGIGWVSGTRYVVALVWSVKVRILFLPQADAWGY